MSNCAALSRLSVYCLMFLSTVAFAAQEQDYRKLVTTCLDTLIEHGQDTYGPETTPILVSILDVGTLTCPENPAVLDEPWRVIRRFILTCGRSLMA